MIDGKLGRFGGAVDTKIEGTGAITKFKGEYKLSAMITASQAHKIQELAKKVPAEQEARTRARAPGLSTSATTRGRLAGLPVRVAATPPGVAPAEHERLTPLPQATGD